MLDRLDATTRQAVEAFIEFFEGKLDLPALRAWLEKLQEGQLSKN